MVRRRLSGAAFERVASWDPLCRCVWIESPRGAINTCPSQGTRHPLLDTSKTLPPMATSLYVPVLRRHGLTREIIFFERQYFRCAGGQYSRGQHAPPRHLQAALDLHGVTLRGSSPSLVFVALIHANHPVDFRVRFDVRVRRASYAISSETDRESLCDSRI